MTTDSIPASTANRSVARQVTLVAVLLVVLAFVVVSIAVGVITTRATRAQIITGVGDTVEGVTQSIDSVDAANRELIRRSVRSFQRNFEATMQLDEATGELRSYGALVNGDYSPVDKFSADTGGVATVFARKGDDFIRITTSLKNEKGERAQGTLLARTSPAYPPMLKGEPYSGRTMLFGKPYMAHYEPVKDAAGKVNAILFIGTELSAFQNQLQKQVTDTRFYAHGGVYVIDPGGKPENSTFVVHPTASGKKVLEVFPNASEFLGRLYASGADTITDAVPLLPEQGADPWAVVRKAGSGWLVVGEVSDHEALAGQRRALWTVWAVMAVSAILLGAAIFIMMRRNVSQPLRELTGAVTAVAQGDLTQSFRSTRRDEIGALVQEVEGMRLRYTEMLQQVRTSVDSITTASAEIASGNQDLSARTEAAASSLAQTAQSMEQLTATVRQSADSARQANQLASTAAEVAARGGRVVGDVVTTMGDINQSSRKIADIIGVIDSIAFQTNILALNAAVEAARAGEQGRGFAVVASEVRSLAGRSAEAAREIKQLIGASVEKVESGARLVQNAGTTMDEIVGSVKRVGDIIGEITSSAAEQSDGIGQVNIAVSQLDQMTQQNAALVEESAAAAQSLREQATRLAGAVQVFKLSGADAGATALPAPGADRGRAAPAALQAPQG